jgi:hypothetical protein
MNKDVRIKSLKDSIGGIVKLPVNKIILVKGGEILADDAETLASRGICQGTVITYIENVGNQPVELIQPAHEVKKFMREVSAALKREPTSLDEIADKLIAGEFETTNHLRDLLDKDLAEELGISLVVRSQIKKMLQ